MNSERGKKSGSKEMKPLMDRRQVDRLHSAVSRTLAGHDFKSSGEVNEFLQKQLEAGAFEWESLGPGPEATPLERAQETFYQALDAPSRGMGIKMVRQALSICEDCADAWVFLAQEAASTAGEAEDYLKKAIAAAARALGQERFEGYRGHFWGAHETRPYMRAREALARALADRGKIDEAIVHWEEMLSLNANDNQGVRMNLLSAYLKRNDQEKTAALFRQFPQDASCEMAYGRVLYDLQRGDQRAARKALRLAFKINSYVPLFLLGYSALPRTVPDHVTWGGEDEAGAYALGEQTLWLRTAGALELLRTILLEKPRRRAQQE